MRVDERRRPFPVASYCLPCKGALVALADQSSPLCDGKYGDGVALAGEPRLRFGTVAEAGQLEGKRAA